MIDLENRFRHPNQSNPKSMDAVFVRTIGVRERAQCCWVQCVHVAHQSTHSRPLPQLSWKKIVKTVHFLSLRTMLVTESDCLLRMENWLFHLWNAITPIPTGILLSAFFWSKSSGKKKLRYRPPEMVPLMKTVGRLRTQTLRENDGPIGIPIDHAPRQETLPVDVFWKTSPFAMQSNAKIDQCVETRLRWNWPK